MPSASLGAGLAGPEDQPPRALSCDGGHYVADMFDASWVLGGAYAYHLTEDSAVEASGAYTRPITSVGGPELERAFLVLEGRDRGAMQFFTNLVYSPPAREAAGGSPPSSTSTSRSPLERAWWIPPPVERHRRQRGAGLRLLRGKGDDCPTRFPGLHLPAAAPRPQAVLVSDLAATPGGGGDAPLHGVKS